MSNEPDFDRLSEIAQRLEDAQDKPNYRDAFQKAVAEAEDACGEHQQFMEFWRPLRLRMLVRLRCASAAPLPLRKTLSLARIPAA